MDNGKNRESKWTIVGYIYSKMLCNDEFKREGLQPVHTGITVHLADTLMYEGPQCSHCLLLNNSSRIFQDFHVYREADSWEQHGEA